MRGLAIDFGSSHPELYRIALNVPAGTGASFFPSADVSQSSSFLHLCILEQLSRRCDVMLCLNGQAQANYSLQAIANLVSRAPASS